MCIVRVSAWLAAMNAGTISSGVRAAVVQETSVETTSAARIPIALTTPL